MRQITCEKINIAKKIAVTIAVIILVRLIYFIPVPGVEFNALADFYRDHIQAQRGGWLDFVELLHVGKLRHVSLFSLGIMPFINACIIMQIVGFLVPGINRKFFYQKRGRVRLFYSAVVVAFILNAIYAYNVSLDLELMNNFPGFNILTFSGMGFSVISVVSLSAALGILLCLSAVVNRWGIGNGIGIIFGSEVIVRVFFAIDQLLIFFARNLIDIKVVAIFLSILTAFIIIARSITGFSKKIELISHEKNRFFISVRPFWMGIWPLIITEMIFSYLRISLNFTSFGAVLITIMFLNFLYLKIVYQPMRLYELILKHKCKTCDKKVKRFEDQLNSAVLIVMGFTIALSVLIYYLPVILPLVLKISFVSGGIFGSFGIIIFIGLYYDIVKQIKFYQNIRNSAVKNWQLLEIAQDETEAVIKQACFTSQDIQAQIKPSHFVWGLPIRTASSGYYLYIEQKKIKQAQAIMKELHKSWKEKAV